MYKVLKLWPSFKQFTSTRQMACSGLHSATCRIGMNGRTMRRLLKDFKCYNMKFKLNISE